MSSPLVGDKEDLTAPLVADIEDLTRVLLLLEIKRILQECSSCCR